MPPLAEPERDASFVRITVVLVGGAFLVLC